MPTCTGFWSTPTTTPAPAVGTVNCRTERLPEHPAAGGDLVDGLVVRRALATLSAEHREVLVLRYFADLGERQTAEVLGVAPGTVKSRTARALAALSAHDDIAALAGERRP